MFGFVNRHDACDRNDIRAIDEAIKVAKNAGVNAVELDKAQKKKAEWEASCVGI